MAALAEQGSGPLPSFMQFMSGELQKRYSPWDVPTREEFESALDDLGVSVPGFAFKLYRGVQGHRININPTSTTRTAPEWDPADAELIMGTLGEGASIESRMAACLIARCLVAYIYECMLLCDAHEYSMPEGVGLLGANSTDWGHRDPDMACMVSGLYEFANSRKRARDIYDIRHVVADMAANHRARHPEVQEAKDRRNKEKEEKRERLSVIAKRSLARESE